MMRYIFQFFIVLILSGTLLLGISMMESDPSAFLSGAGLTVMSLALLVGALAKIGVISLQPYLSSSLSSDLGRNPRECA